MKDPQGNSSNFFSAENPGNDTGKNDPGCPECGNKIVDGKSVFCDKCGFQLFAISPVRVQQTEKPLLVTRPIPDKKNCPGCGTTLPDEYRYYGNSEGLSSFKVSCYFRFMRGHSRSPIDGRSAPCVSVGISQGQG